MAASLVASWFETREDALLTMRVDAYLLVVIARSEATKQSIFLCMDIWIASLRSQ